MQVFQDTAFHILHYVQFSFETAAFCLHFYGICHTIVKKTMIYSHNMWKMVILNTHKFNGQQRTKYVPVKVFPHQNVRLLELCLIEWML